MKPARDMKQTLTYKAMITRVKSLSGDEKGAALLKALAIGTQWRIDAVLEAIDSNLDNWSYINTKNVFEQAAMFGRLEAIQQMSKSKYFSASGHLRKACHPSADV